MRRAIFFLCFVIMGFSAMASPARASPDVHVEIEIGSQVMQVFVNGYHRHTWRVSTGRRGYDTPTGRYRPKRLERTWYSTRYDDAPMPYSVFFRGGYAIHGTNEVKRLGRRASHGCVRLAPSHAAKLFSLIRRYGMHNTVIAISH